jgi:hypothetical protein
LLYSFDLTDWFPSALTRQPAEIHIARCIARGWKANRQDLSGLSAGSPNFRTGKIVWKVLAGSAPNAERNRLVINSDYAILLSV